MWALLVIRFIHGIWFSILTTVTVPIANDFIPDHRKGEGMGYFVMSTNLAVVFGPLIALTVLQFTDFISLFAILTAVICLGFIFCLMVPIQENKLGKLTEKSRRKTVGGCMTLLKCVPYRSALWHY